MFTYESSVFRVVLVGESAVGKTCIMNRLVKNTFDTNEQSTVGAMFVLYSVDVGDERIEMQIWDTAGQEKFAGLGPIYYRNASAAVIVFDVTRADTFAKVPTWIERFREVAGGDAFIIIVGNKCDCVDEFDVAEKAVEELANSYGCKYVLASAKEGTGVPEIFRFIGEDIAESERKIIDYSGPRPVPKDEKKGCNC